MSFLPSSPPDFTEALPYLISAREASRPTVDGGISNVISVGGIAFQLAGLPSQNIIARPKQGRVTIPVQKQQLDTSKEPGEHSLDNFWLRSQTSWHNGAGINYYEPGDISDTQYRFLDSLGVDVWKQDQITLLKRMSSQAVAAGSSYVAAAVAADGTDLLIYSAGGTLRKMTAAGVVTSYTTTNAPVSRVAVAGSKLIYGHALGIDQVDVDGTTSAVLHTQASGVVPVPYWVKSRIIASRGASLFEVTLATGVNLDTATPLYVHPNANWTWSSVTEAPSSIFAAGYGSGNTAIYRFSLMDATSGQTPKLSQAYQVAELPPGEYIQSIRSYLGKYLGVATSKGLRIGIIGANSTADDVTLGPLLFETTSPVSHLTARGSYLYAGITNGLPDGTSGLVRVDLSAPIGNSLRFPYAWDAQAGQVGAISSVATIGATDRMALGVVGLGVYVQSATDYVDSGYLTSGRIRYATVAPKAFYSLDLRADLTSGKVSVSTIEPSGSEVLVAALTSATGDTSGVGLDPTARVEFLQYKLLLTRTDAAATPIVQSIQIRALPAPSRQREIRYALQCFDREQDQNGVRFGYEGFAWDRVQSLEHLEDTYAIVEVDDMTTGESYMGSISSIEMIRSQAPDGPFGNFGGFIELAVRKL